MAHHCKDYGRPHDHAHGTTSGRSYHGCGCEPCEVAHYSYHRTKNRERASDPKRLASNRMRAREMRKLGHPSYANHGDNSAHKRSGWEAAKRHREANRHAINERSRAKAASVRQSVGANRRWWTPDDDAVVMRDDITLMEMAYLINRTRGAIAQRRLRLHGGARPRYFKSDRECMRGHSRDVHGRKSPTQWICRECQRLAKARYIENRKAA